MDEENVKTVKEIIVEKYGSINKFLDVKTVEYKGELPLSRQQIYNLIAHGTDNPGIKTLNMLSDMIGIDRQIIYKEYSI